MSDYKLAKKKMKEIKMNLEKFGEDLNVQVSENNPASVRAFYDKNLVLNAKPVLVHTQFGQKRTIPKNGGKRIVFRKLAPLPKATTPLTEGVTPTGNSMTWSTVEASLDQYGDYITVSDVVQTTGIDNTLVEAGEILAMQAGETLDAVAREVMNSGTNVQYAANGITRCQLVGGKESGNNYLTVEDIKKAVRTLKRNNTKTINGYYVGIIHPDVAFDLMNDPLWENVKTYCDPEDMYNGEIGRLYGVRFVETSEAKIFRAPDLVSESRTLSIDSVSGKTITVEEEIYDYDNIKGRKILINGKQYTVNAASTANNTITVFEPLASGTSAPKTNDLIYPGESAAEGRNVYSTLILGANAYGVTEIDEGGLKNIVKPLGSGGTADPLDQRATTGWKALTATKILVDEYLVRIESTSSYDEPNYEGE